MTRAWPVLLALAACLGTSPEQAERDALGDDPGEEGEEHRPGQPCLLCHAEFVVAGTIYARAGDSESLGVPGALVEVTDAQGRTFTAPTNRVGNFMVEYKDDVDAPRVNRRGHLLIPWDPEFPLSVTVRRDAIEQKMESFAWREGSCAGCHRGSEETADRVPKVYLIEEGM